jgi:hypothetical protein
MINDLIGLNYKAGARYFDGCAEIDCFALLCETRRRLGLYDYEAEFQWVYEEEKLPVRKIVKAMQLIATEISDPINGDMAIMSGGMHRLSVGVVINGGILTIAHGMKSFWSPMRKARFYSSLNG